jgi:hypothetical protein
MSEQPQYPGTPRWVKASGIVVGILALLVVVVVAAGVGGPHGPGRHLRSGDAGGVAPSSGAAEGADRAGGISTGSTPPEGGRR